MAFINCPECGKEISDLAEKCPHCGFPMCFQSSSSQPANNNTYQPRIPENFSPEKPKNSALGIIALILSILGCTFIIGIVLAIIDLCKKDGRKKVCSIIALCICGFWLIIGIIGSSGKDSSEKATSENFSTESNQDSVSKEDNINSTESNTNPVEEKTPEPEAKDKYYVGDLWENKTLRMTYTTCYEFTDYNQYNAPSAGNKIICAEFEFENIGDSDTTVMYTDFHGYADGYEVSQSYAPDGTGLDFTVKMSAGRKGTGKVAFEVPEDAQEIEIEFSPNFWTSENIIFVYE